MPRLRTLCTSLLAGLAASAAAAAAGAGPPPGESGNLPAVRLEQADIAAGRVSLDALRRMGLRLFTTPVNRHDGYGDGPRQGVDALAPGDRPTLQGNGTFLRINGLDAQTCLECHSIVRAGTRPPTLGIGGAGGSVTNAIIMPAAVEAHDDDGDGAAHFTGRFANPPFLFGVGGVELLALEMTAELQALKARALAHPGEDVELETKGVWFGTLRADASGVLDTSGVQGVDADLVVRPFGRKGEFASVREFDVGAMQFHFGMQPSESVGEGVDADGDGVADEIRPGDLTALHVFAVTLEHPFQERASPAARRGRAQFEALGCVECHRPSLVTERRRVPLRQPEVPTQPFANTVYEVDLSRGPGRYDRARGGGLEIPLFSDLRRHDLGEALREDFAGADAQRNREFVTARLWGVADSAPYLHDGRALTLTEAILLHGGEAEPVRRRFEALGDDARTDVLAFLRTLRTPADPARDLLRAAAHEAQDRGGGDAREAHGGRGPRGEPWYAGLVRWLLR